MGIKSKFARQNYLIIPNQKQRVKDVHNVGNLPVVISDHPPLMRMQLRRGQPPAQGSLQGLGKIMQGPHGVVPHLNFWIASIDSTRQSLSRKALSQDNNQFVSITSKIMSGRGRGGFRGGRGGRGGRPTNGTRTLGRDDAPFQIDADVDVVLDGKPSELFPVSVALHFIPVLRTNRLLSAAI